MPTRFARASSLVTRKIAGQTVVVPVASGLADMESVYTLNEVGTAIWDLLPGSPDLTGIREALAREFEVAPGRAEADALEFLSVLRDEGLITVLRCGEEASP